MAKVSAPKINEPNLPWVDHSEDRSFRWMMIAMVVIFLGAGIVLNQITLPDVVQKNLVDVSPRLAKLILEKQKVKPPEPKKVIPEKKEVEKKKEKPKKKEKKKEKPKKKKEEPKKSAKEVAQNTGLIALSDELEDLRESFELDDVMKLPQTNTGKQEVKVAAASASDLLSASAGQSSGGIQTNTLNRKITTSELAQRKKTSKVESKIESEQQLALAAAKQKQLSSSGGSGGGGGIRSSDEIERVFQRNKGGIFNLYNRALRSNPSLAGQVVFELTISPTGQVTKVAIVSSELGDEKLERKLVLKIKKFKFTKANVAEMTVTYPIEFLPS